MTRPSPAGIGGGDERPPQWRAFVDRLPVDHCSIVVMTPDGLSATVSASDAVAERLDEVQLELGEGPHWTAFRSGRPVLVPDTDRPEVREAWPLFSAALTTSVVRAVFAMPLTLGASIIGVAGLACDVVSKPWSERVVSTALDLAAATEVRAADLATRSASSDTDPAAPELRREVHQATGMLVVQLRIGPGDALLRLRAHAFRRGRPLLDVAREILDGRLDLSAENA